MKTDNDDHRSDKVEDDDAVRVVKDNSCCRCGHTLRTNRKRDLTAKEKQARRQAGATNFPSIRVFDS